MKKQIIVEPLDKSFSVSMKGANRNKRNRYYSNASNCCGKKLKQRKFCSECEEEVEYGSSERKIVEIGGDEYLIDKNALDSVKEKLSEMEDLKLHTFLKGFPKGSEDRFDDLIYAYPEEKKEGDYAELKEVLKGRVAVGKGVFRSNEYQVLAFVGNDGVIRVRKLVEESQRYDFNPEKVEEEIKGKKPNDEIIELENKILDKKTQNSYDITDFRDTRQEFEERVIEDYIVNGKVPEVKSEMSKEQDKDELERLKKLAEA